ncbi:MAG: Phenylacetic acid catabolic protein [Acidobacteriota bacterium]
MTTLTCFDDWIDLFQVWQKDIDLDPAIVEDYRFDAKYGDLRTPEIEFGDYAGQRKWEKVLEVPDQRIRDGLEHLIVYQGDTEFASVEQQKHLISTAPTDYDLDALVRVMREEMRHGWQMSHILMNYFGHSGKIEARKLLERRAFTNSRLLGSFNEVVENWLDFFVYTEFIDRDGKFQLQMLSSSSFAPLARSMGPMLKEESFHLGTGHNGLRRIIEAGKIPVPIIQKYFYKWIPTAFDLFGVDHSSSAHWAYVWGLKGRFDEATAEAPADKENLNETARNMYITEIGKLVDSLNQQIPDGEPKLRIPHLRFQRKIGDDADRRFNVDGESLNPEQYPSYLRETLPGPEDRKILEGILRGKEWISPKGKTPI